MSRSPLGPPADLSDNTCASGPLGALGACGWAGVAMSRLFGHREHLVRVAGLFLAGVVVFVVLQALLIPEGFGLYGHYRAGRARRRARPARRARRPRGLPRVPRRRGRQRPRAADTQASAARPATARSPRTPGTPRRRRPCKPDAAVLCVRCHQANVARPAGFPQKDRAEHAGDEVVHDLPRRPPPGHPPDVPRSRGASGGEG